MKNEKIRIRRKTKAMTLAICIVAIMLTSVFVMVTASAQAADSPWPMLRHDAPCTANSSYSGPEEPNFIWNFPMDYFCCTPAIADDGTIIAPEDDYLYALNPDGTERWNVSMDLDLFYGHSAPAIGKDGTIYVWATDSRLHALDAADGHEIWNVSIEVSPHFPVIGDDGTIYIRAINLYAINPDGSIKWQSDELEEFDLYSFYYDFVLSPDSSRIYTYGSGKQWMPNQFFALDTATGKTVWNVSSEPYVNLAVGADGTIYGCKWDHLVALDPADGTENWCVEIGSHYANRPAINGNTIYVVSSDGNLYAISDTGSLKWKSPVPYWLFHGAPIIGGDGTVYVASKLILYAIEPKDGEKKWLFGCGRNSQPAIGEDGTLYVGQSRGLCAIGEAEPTTFRNNSYLFVHKLMTWHEAQSYAESLGGHLVTINDSEENKFVDRLAGESGKVGHFWIGLTDEAEEGNFKWVTGEPLDYTTWGPGEPTDEDYAVYLTRCCRLWGTVNESEPRQFMVEFEGTPTPATVTNCISFNTGEWTDLRSVFSNSTEILGYTNNKYGGTASMYLWLSFATPSAISLRPCPDELDPTAGEPNWGDRAELEIEEIASSELASRLAADNVPDDLGAELIGPYIYRLTVTAPDHGYHSSYIFSFDSPPNYAIGKGEVDDLEWLGRVRVCNVGTQ